MRRSFVPRAIAVALLSVFAVETAACFGPWRRHERREERRDDRYERRDDRQDDRYERRDDRQDDRRERWD
jgi:hypothetical protein